MPDADPLAAGAAELRVRPGVRSVQALERKCTSLTEALAAVGRAEQPGAGDVEFAPPSAARQRASTATPPVANGDSAATPAVDANGASASAQAQHGGTNTGGRQQGESAHSQHESDVWVTPAGIVEDARPVPSDDGGGGGGSEGSGEFRFGAPFGHVGARGVAEEGGDWANLDDEDHERIVWEHFCVLRQETQTRVLHGLFGLTHPSLPYSARLGADGEAAPHHGHHGWRQRLVELRTAPVGGAAGARAAPSPPPQPQPQPAAQPLYSHGQDEVRFSPTTRQQAPPC